MAGQVWGAERRRRDTAWLDSSPTRGKTQRSVGTPSRTAVPAEQNSRAAAWLTVHWVECHLLYGKARGRLAGDGVAISSASMGAGKAASGLVPGHPVEAGPQLGHLGPVVGKGQAFGGPEGVLDHGVLLDGVPQPVGHLDRLHERALPAAGDVGDHAGLAVSTAGPADALGIPGPPLGLPAHHRGHLGGTPRRWRPAPR